MRHGIYWRWRWRWRWLLLRPSPPLSIAPRAPCMGEASCAGALIASPRLAQRRTPRLRAAFTAAVAPASVAYVAHHHLGLAACTDEPPGADRPGKGSTRRSSCRHRRARSNLLSALRGRTNLPTLDGIARRCNTLLALVVTRWGAAVETTCRSLRLSRPFYFTVLFYLGKTLGVHRRAAVRGGLRSSRRHSNPGWPPRTPPPVATSASARENPHLPLSCANFQGLFGKRSASGRRLLSGSGGQVTDPAGAVHRLVLWTGDLSTAGG